MDEDNFKWALFWIILIGGILTLVIFMQTKSWWTVIEFYSMFGFSFMIAGIAGKVYLCWRGYLNKVSKDYETLIEIHEKSEEFRDKVYSDLRTLKSIIQHQTERNDALKSVVVATLKKLHEVSKNAPQSKADEARKQVLGLNE